MRERLLWRGGLPPLGCEAAPNQATTLCQESRVYRFDDCFAAERGQAPSPQDSGLLHECISSPQKKSIR
ncbi:hypothetical protein B0D71_24165 [Pseudomonas laurylsulfativorans]|uniref:Uncharacterized protein n=1 Tax=Pseudomonas laurylsulfativorans TaxID=1943631 RepID=A0A2S3VIK3_9PSED|nr:hypothetical protein B0D71_24165 [Pseudomonas laurylsulfativorans]